VREQVVHVLKNVPSVLAPVWPEENDYDKMVTKLVKLHSKKTIAETPLKQELILWNEVCLMEFGSLNERRP
jgi:hypothetical protein